MRNRIFISYAREDAEIAEILYADLEKRNLGPWMDSKDLLPGERWKVRIREVITECSHFLFLMSSRSTSKRGYVQKEVREALGVLEESPVNRIFLIPIRIDECSPGHEEICDINWVDIFPSYEKGLERILLAIRLGRPAEEDMSTGGPKKRVQTKDGKKLEPQEADQSAGSSHSAPREGGKQAEVKVLGDANARLQDGNAAQAQDDEENMNAELAATGVSSGHESLRNLPKRTVETAAPVGGCGRPAESAAASFNAEHRTVLENVLRRENLLGASHNLPEPFDRTTGAGNLSAVYFLFVPSDSHATGRLLVAKFDTPRRQAREWRAIQELKRINTPPGIMLPISGNRANDGVIVLSAIQGFVGHFRCQELRGLLQKQTVSNPDNCINALERAFSVLAAFYDAEPGAAQLASEGVLLTWKIPFGALASPKSDTMRSIFAALSTIWPEADGSRELLPPSVGLSSDRPNPLFDLDSRVSMQCGPVMLSRIHGDLNLGNILLALESDRRVSEAFIIDFPGSQTDRVQAFDFARVEAEYWRHVFPALYMGSSRDTAIQDFIVIRDYLDGREEQLPDTASPIVVGVVSVVGALRGLAYRRLNPTLRTAAPYALEDYFHCLHFTSLYLLKHPDVQANALVTRTLLLSSSLAQQYLHELDIGLYADGSRQRRWLPPRPSPQTRHHDRPEPPPPPPEQESVEGELKSTGPPISTPARLPNTSSYSTLPVDVGTTWGLERGPFIGILEGGHELQTRQALVHAEAAIRVAQNKAQGSPSLPSRRWFEVDVATLPLGPADETELWSTVRKGSGTSSVLDESEGLLGLFIPLEPGSIEEQLGICRGWIDGTYGLVDPHRVAMVFHARGDDGIGTRLLDGLEGRSPVPLQLLRSGSSTEATARDHPSRAERDFMNSGKATSPDVHLASWLWSLFEAKRIDSRALKDHHPELASWLKRLANPTREAARAASRPDVHELLDALVRLPADGALTADVVALALSVDGAAAFVRAAAGASASVRLAALKASVAGEAERVDALVDAWLDGHSLNPDDMPHGASLVAHPAEVAEPLALGLMRRLARDGERERIEACWRRLESRLRPHIRATWTAFEDAAVRRDLLGSRSACDAAFRSGLVGLYPIHLSRELLEDLDFHYWWLLQAQPPVQEQLKVLLSLRPDRRAVVGLNTRQEREDIRTDPNLLEELRACRRGRELG